MVREFIKAVFEDNYNIESDVSNEGIITIQLSPRSLELVEDFKEYITNVEDYLWEEAVNDYTLRNKSVAELNDMVKNPTNYDLKKIELAINDFKQSVKNVAVNAIIDLKKKYNI